MSDRNEKPPSELTSLDGVFSDMYDRLVNDSDDLSGMIAYGFYQLEKREWARAYYLKNDKAPPNNEVSDYSNKYQSSALKTLKDRADGILFQYANAFLDEQYPAIQEKAFNERAALELAKLQDKIKGMSKLWHHVVTHIISFTFFLCLVYFVLHVIPLEPHVATFFGLTEGAKTTGR